MTNMDGEIFGSGFFMYVRSCIFVVILWEKKVLSLSFSLFLGLDLHLVIRLLVDVGKCALLGKIMEQSS